MVDAPRTDELSALPDGKQCREAISFLRGAADNARAAAPREGHANFARYARSAVINLERAANALGFDLTPRAEGKDMRAP